MPVNKSRVCQNSKPPQRISTVALPMKKIDPLVESPGSSDSGPVPVYFGKLILTLFLVVRCLWFQHHLKAVVLLVHESIVPLGRFIQRQAVSNDKAWIDFVFLNPVQQRSKVMLHVCLPGF